MENNIPKNNQDKESKMFVLFTAILMILAIGLIPLVYSEEQKTYTLDEGDFLEDSVIIESPFKITNAEKIEFRIGKKIEKLLSINKENIIYKDSKLEIPFTIIASKEEGVYEGDFTITYEDFNERKEQRTYNLKINIIKKEKDNESKDLVLAKFESITKEINVEDPILIFNITFYSLSQDDIDLEIRYIIKKDDKKDEEENEYKDNRYYLEEKRELRLVGSEYFPLKINLGDIKQGRYSFDVEYSFLDKTKELKENFSVYGIETENQPKQKTTITKIIGIILICTLVFFLIQRIVRIHIPKFHLMRLIKKANKHIKADQHHKSKRIYKKIQHRYKKAHKTVKKHTFHHCKKIHSKLN